MQHTVQVKRFFPLLALILLLPSLTVEALELGDLVVQSTPGKPLRADIPVFLKPEESLAELRVRLASEQGYRQAQLERPEMLDDMRIALQARGENRGRIQLFGTRPWQGEEVQLLLQLEWPTGEVSRHFRVAPVETRQSARSATPRYVEVTGNESLDSIAIRLSKQSNRSYMHMMVALFKANPEAFYRNNLNNLKNNVRLRVPTSEELYRLSDNEVFSILREHKERWQASNKSKGATPEAKLLAEQLQQVSQENAEAEQRNQEMQMQLRQLEQQVGEMSQRLLEYETGEETTGGAADSRELPSAAESKPAGEQEPKNVEEPRLIKGALSAPLMLSLMSLVALVVVGMRRFAPPPGGQG